MTLDGVGPHGWGTFRGVLALESVDAAGTFLREQMSVALASAGVFVSGLRDEELGNSIATSLEDPEAMNQLTDRQVAILRGQFPLEDRLSDPLMAVAHDVIESGVLKDLLGTRHTARMHMPIMARFVLPGNGGAGVPAHFDRQYNRHMTDFLTVWVPLVTVDPECGGVRVFGNNQVSESRKLHDADSSSGVTRSWHTPLQTSGLTAHECVPMQTGDLLYFGNQVVHESMANRSKRTRFSLDMRFLLQGASSTKTIFDFGSGKSLDPDVLGRAPIV